VAEGKGVAEIFQRKPRRRVEAFIATGPAEHSGWTPGLSIEVEFTGPAPNLRVTHALEFTSAERGIRLLSRFESVDFAALEPATQQRLLAAVGVDRDVVEAAGE
jgi:hypothetical protein